MSSEQESDRYAYGMMAERATQDTIGSYADPRSLMGEIGGNGRAGVDSESSNDESSDDDSEDNDDVISTKEVIRRIEEWIVAPIIEQLDRYEPPYLSNQNRTSPTRARNGGNIDDDSVEDDDDDNSEESNHARPNIIANFQHLTHCRKLTSMLLVASYCHELLLHGRTTATLREVYYYFCTHFNSQSECNTIIQCLSDFLQVPRASLGLLASPKGWWSGYLTIFNKSTNEQLVQGHQGFSSLHGMAISGTSLDTWKREYRLDASHSKCILVIESESVYTRLVEASFWTQFPCILVTGKGFPDVATRTWVQYLQQQLNLPAYGICDCNPYGVSVLQTYTYRQKTYTKKTKKASRKRSADHMKDDSKHRPLDLYWVGLRPSQLADLDLPSEVLQEVTENDLKRVEYLHRDEHRSYCTLGRSTRRELEYFKDTKNGCKVELEALHWKGMDFLSRWLKQQLFHFEQLRLDEEEALERQQNMKVAAKRTEANDGDDDESDEGSTARFSSYRI